MSSNLSIKVDSLGKCYEIYEKPRDRLLQMLARGRRKFYKEFWALRDVSFEIKTGSATAIIGRNGSGKSTLLQLICGTLKESAGSIMKSGRVAALLELGSGFNPEFTGRENVYLNAGVLGLKKEEIDARFDKIAEFADIGEFIDRPVKTYSSGMYVRLAFSVIAHVDADILIVDEALSVGDAVFTQKCMRFIRDFMQRGTLLFVSHDMAAVQNLCQDAIWLDKGAVRMQGKSKRVAEEYLRYTLQEVYGKQIQLEKIESVESVAVGADFDESAEPEVDIYGGTVAVDNNFANATGWNTGVAEILDVQFAKLRASSDDAMLEGGEKVRVTIKAKAHQDLASPILGFVVKDRLGQILFGENTLPFSATRLLSIPAGDEFEATFDFRLPMLPNGEYAVMASVADGDLTNNTQHHYLHDALFLTVSSSAVRWGLVGVQFDHVQMRIVNEHE